MSRDQMERLTSMADFNHGFVRVVRADGDDVTCERADGSLFPLPDYVPFTGIDVGEVFRVKGDDWSIAHPSDWTERTKIGVVEALVEGTAVVRSDLVLLTATNPSALVLAAGNTIMLNLRNEVLKVVSEAPMASDTVKVDSSDSFDVEQLRQPHAETLRWNQFGGFPYIVEQAKEIVDVHLGRRKEFAKFEVTPLRGVIFAGPPGTGKTFLGRIIAARSKATLYVVSAAELGGRLVGESEGRLQRLYDRAARDKLAIIFFDEIDSVTMQRGSDANAHSDRLVSTFLQNMDGFKSKDNILTIGTTNRTEVIDKALLREGRFGQVIHFEHPNAADRTQILKVGASRPSVKKGLDHAAVAAMTEGWSGADLEAIWTAAATFAISARRSQIAADHYFMGLEKIRARRIAGGLAS